MKVLLFQRWNLTYKKELSDSGMEDFCSPWSLSPYGKSFTLFSSLETLLKGKSDLTACRNAFSLFGDFFFGYQNVLEALYGVK